VQNYLYHLDDIIVISKVHTTEGTMIIFLLTIRQTLTILNIKSPLDLLEL